MSLDIAQTFEMLFDKNNNIAYKALQELQKESDKTNHVYLYMDKLSDMLITIILIFAQEGLHYSPIMQNGIKIIKLMK